jgi:hypothetical protein
MTWVTFPDRASFDAYHQAACAANGIPRPGKNAADNATVHIDHQWTDAWVNITGAFVAAPGAYLLVNVPPEDVTIYGLTVAPNPPRFPTPDDPRPPSIVFNGASRNILTVAADWHQPIPTSWTDPVTHITYTVP